MFYLKKICSQNQRVNYIFLCIFWDFETKMKLKTKYIILSVDFFILFVAFCGVGKSHIKCFASNTKQTILRIQAWNLWMESL